MTRWTVPICLDDCRHTFASMLIAAGVSAKALSTFMGHANISVTLDRYGHLAPGAEHEAAGLLDAYLTASPAVIGSAGACQPRGPFGPRPPAGAQ